MSNRKPVKTARKTIARSEGRAAKRTAAATASRHDSRRPLIVFVTLIAFITGTSTLLLALSRPPLTPDTLMAVKSNDGIQSIFDTQIPTASAQWQTIYIHHSRTPDGNAQTLAQVGGDLADHFVIANGEGGVDGQIEVSQRWHQQRPGAYIDTSTISICLIGDFDRSLPTNAQVQQLNRLVAALQSKLQIPTQNIIIRDDPASPAGIGQYFPTTAFRSQLDK